jgi:hypothetical protein
MRALKEWESNHKEAEVPDDIINEKNWPKTIDAIREHLGNRLGVTKIPLAYIIRDSATVPNSNADPEDGYASRQDEMIARAPHTFVPPGAIAPVRTDTFKTDNAKVWEILSKMTRDKTCWTYVKQGQRNKDGRVAFMALYDHYLGPNHMNHEAAQAEATLNRLTYQGEKKRFNFEVYATAHAEQHTILNELVTHGYSGIDGASKVRRLLNGIKTDKLDAAKNAILADPNLRQDFPKAVNLIQDFIRQSDALQSHTKTFNVSQVSTARPKGGGTSTSKPKYGKPTKGKPKVGTVDHVEDRYYTPAEYSTLTREAKGKLVRLREGRGAAKKNKKRKGSNKSFGLDQRTIKAIKSIAKQLSKEDKSGDSNADDSDSSEDEDDEVPMSNNRSNPALSRQKRAKK